jgi:hypothetical protein
VNDVLYLCEAKHTMCIDKVPKIPQRIKIFKEQFQQHAQEEFSIGINNIVGVACGTYFPPLVREKAHKLGLICVYLRVGDTMLKTSFQMDLKLNLYSLACITFLSMLQNYVIVCWWSNYSFRQ